jgi:hypothetical protein
MTIAMNQHRSQKGNTMIVRVICTGPSLSVTWQRDGVGMIGPIIGVNRAVDYTACDWLVAGDAITFGRISGKPLRGVCTFNNNIREYVPPRWQPIECVAWEDLQHPPEPAQWGIEAALLLARRIAGNDPLDIVIFGCDRRGLNDWDGTPPADDRSEDRWAREAFQFDRTVRWLESATLTHVRRITP